MVNAIAPKAPRGASLMMMPTIAEQHVGELSTQSSSQRAAPTEPLQRKAEHHREQQHLQDLALGEGVDHAGRDHDAGDQSERACAAEGDQYADGHVHQAGTDRDWRDERGGKPMRTEDVAQRPDRR